MSTDASRPHRIDLHAHYLASAYTEALGAAEMRLIGGIPVPDWTPERSLRGPFDERRGAGMPGGCQVPRSPAPGWRRAALEL